MKSKNRKNLLTISALAFLILPVLLLTVFSSPVAAKETAATLENQELPTEFKIPGRIEGTGTYFEIKDSQYLNIVLNSAEEVKVVLESIPRMISLDISSSADSTFTDLTIEGLEPNKTYFKYQDSYKNKAVFLSDENGSYSWNQDLTQSHHIWLQEEKGTIFLPKDCSDYGIWDETTSTCTLTQDLTQSVEITENNITLDCSNHTITGSGTGYGIFIRNSGQRRNALHHKIDAIEKMIDEDNINGAIHKLEYDVKNKIERWLVNDYEVENPLELSKNEVTELVDEILERFNFMLGD